MKVLIFADGYGTRLSEGALGFYKHHRSRRPMDMLRDKKLLNGMWESGIDPRKVW